MRDIFLAHSIRDAKGTHVGGSDRQSNHRYGDAYDALFPNREAVRLVLEIGNADGMGMKAFREAFPNALIVGLDIVPSCRETDRLEFNIGDQRRREDCERAAKGRKFDLIVEDATHEIANNLLTLFWLWPFVRPGGVYVIEEMENVNSYRENVKCFSGAELIDTIGPSGGCEPLVVLRKAK